MEKKRWKQEPRAGAIRKKKEVRKGLKGLGISVPACRPGKRCGCEHCHICLRLYRNNLIRQARRLHLARKKQKWLTLTLTPKDPPIPIGGLSDYDLVKEVAKHKKRLERHLPGVLIIGGLDFALLVRGGVVVGWQPHLHLMIYGITSQASLKALRKVYPKSKFAPKPIRHRPVEDTFNGALSYTYKSVYFPRGDKTMIPRGQKRAGLPRQYELELRAYLAKWQIGSRMILRYAKFYGRPNSANRRLVLMAPYDTEFE